MRLGLFLVALMATSTSPVSALVVDHGVTHDQSVQQGQIFYSDKVSRVTNAQGSACVVSTGSDWKNTAQVRRANVFEDLLAQGASVSEALDQSIAVEIEGLASNTPYLMFLTGNDGASFIRVATGFSITPGTLRIEFGPDFGNVLNSEISLERRGDSGVVSDLESLGLLRNYLAIGGSVRVTARSKKIVEENEHYLSYVFEGGFEQTAFEDCLNDIGNNRITLPIGVSASFAFEPASGLDGSQRQQLRGMACNRDLDPNGAELVRLSGPIVGFSTPLSHALVRRGNEGEIEHVWSGDLWRISRNGDGYEVSFSRSIVEQSPGGEQVVKSCMQFGDARCAELSYRGSKFHVGPCFGEFLSGTGLNRYLAFSADPGNTTNGSTGSSVLIASSGSPGSSTIVGGGGTPISLPPAGDVETLTIVTGDPPDKKPPKETTPNSAVPLPETGLLLLCALPLGWLLARRRRIANEI